MQDYIEELLAMSFVDEDAYGEAQIIGCEYSDDDAFIDECADL